MVRSTFDTLRNALKDPIFAQLQEIDRDRLNRSTGLALWAWKVKGGGEWDASVGIKDMYKSGDKQLYFNAGGRTEVAHQIFGNILFGFLGAGVGYTADSLMTQGEIFDAVTDPKGPNAADREAVLFGMKLWEKYGRNITEGDLAREIEEYIRNNRIHTRNSLNKCFRAQDTLQGVVADRRRPSSSEMAEINAGVIACNGEHR
jgi:hypothetical protein